MIPIDFTTDVEVWKAAIIKDYGYSSSSLVPFDEIQECIELSKGFMVSPMATNNESKFLQARTVMGDSISDIAEAMKKTDMVLYYINRTDKGFRFRGHELKDSK